MALKASTLKVGDSKTLVVVDDLTRTQIVMYAGAGGDYNPLHTDDKFTKEIAGYPGVFAHGMLTMGMTGRVITDWVGDGRITVYEVQFRYADFDIVTLNQKDETVLIGKATAKIDA
jgi:acyl dehydratase